VPGLNTYAWLGSCRSVIRFAGKCDDERPDPAVFLTPLFSPSICFLTASPALVNVNCIGCVQCHMFEQIRILVRRFGRHVLPCQLLLIAFAPFLHAHSAEPSMHAAGFHAYFDLPTQRSGICPWSGDPTSPLTVEVGEFRNCQAVGADGLTCETAVEPLVCNLSAGFDLVEPAFSQTRLAARYPNPPCGAGQTKSAYPPSPQAP